MNTFSAKAHEVKRDWYVFDAENQTLGHAATLIARYLRGKHKAEYTPHVDTGDYIVVINAEKVTVTGRKFKQKMYHRHTGYPGGIKSVTFEDMQDRNPKRIIELAIKGMLPKNILGREMYRKLKVYVGNEHPHTAQQPKKLEIGE